MGRERVKEWCGLWWERESVVGRETGTDNDRKARRGRERGEGRVWMGNLIKKVGSENME